MKTGVQVLSPAGNSYHRREFISILLSVTVVLIAVSGIDTYKPLRHRCFPWRGSEGSAERPLSASPPACGGCRWPHRPVSPGAAPSEPAGHPLTGLGAAGSTGRRLWTPSDSRSSRIRETMRRGSVTWQQQRAERRVLCSGSAGEGGTGWRSRLRAF